MTTEQRVKLWQSSMRWLLNNRGNISCKCCLDAFRLLDMKGDKTGTEEERWFQQVCKCEASYISEEDYLYGYTSMGKNETIGNE